jgi:hypothetical protein
MNYKIISMCLILVMIVSVFPATFASNVSANFNSISDDNLFD